MSGKEQVMKKKLQVATYETDKAYITHFKEVHNTAAVTCMRCLLVGRILAPCVAHTTLFVYILFYTLHGTSYTQNKCYIPEVLTWKWAASVSPCRR